MVTKHKYKMQVLQWELFMLRIHFFFLFCCHHSAVLIQVTKCTNSLRLSVRSEDHTSSNFIHERYTGIIDLNIFNLYLGYSVPGKSVA